MLDLTSAEILVVNIVQFPEVYKRETAAAKPFWKTAILKKRSDLIALIFDQRFAKNFLSVLNGGMLPIDSYRMDSLIGANDEMVIDAFLKAPHLFDPLDPLIDLVTGWFPYLKSISYSKNLSALEMALTPEFASLIGWDPAKDDFSNFAYACRIALQLDTNDAWKVVDLFIERKFAAGPSESLKNVVADKKAFMTEERWWKIQRILN
jgi:hypothetical protein